MIDRIKTIEPPTESLVDDVACDLVQVEQAGGFVGWARWFEGEKRAEKGSDPFFRGVLYLHGIQSHGGWFLRSCDYLRQQGMTVLAPDRRGSGLNAEDRGHCDSPKQLLEDVDCCVEWLRDKTGLDKVDIVAISWSGKLALAYAARQPEKVRSVVLVAPGLKARIDIGLAEKIQIGAEGLVQPKKRHEIPLNDPKLFTTNPAMLQFLEHDPLKLTEATASFFITSRRLDMQVPKAVAELAKYNEHIQAEHGRDGRGTSVAKEPRGPQAHPTQSHGIPVYLFLAEHDRIIDNEATMELLKPVLKAIPRERPQAEHGRDSRGTLVTQDTRRPQSHPTLAKIYKGAHHTLDFEADPGEFFADLIRILRGSG